MKRYALVVLFIFITITPVYSKEYQSSFGFTVDIPEHWLVLTRQELKENPDLFDFDKNDFGNLDKNLLKNVVSEIKSGQMEVYFNQKTSDSNFSDNINVMKQIGKIPENNTQLREVCNLLPDQLSQHILVVLLHHILHNLFVPFVFQIYFLKQMVFLLIQQALL